MVTEYQAQILEDEQGKRFVADFPDGVNSAVQYGNGVKAHAVDVLSSTRKTWQRGDG
jgi:transposase